MEYTIDTANKALGRTAAEAAHILMGKNTTKFVRNKAPEVKVHIKNASQVKMTSKKLDEMLFRHHSGYRGGLKTMNLEQFIKEKGYKELFRHTVNGMLPKNKLRAIMIKNLHVTE